MSDSMVERVARALFESWLKDWGGAKAGPYVFEDLKSYQMAYATQQARAVIEAMREPTMFMITEGEARDDSFRDRAPASWHWEAMIDAALSEPQANAGKV